MQSISLDDVIDSEKKYGTVLALDLNKVRDLKTLNPKSKYDTTYIPIKFRHVNGKLIIAKIKFTEQIIGSAAKAPQDSGDDGGIPKHLNISMMKLLKENIESGDYAPKKKETEQLQEIEDARALKNVVKYMANNEKLIRVLDIIDLSYKALCKELIANEKSYAFRLFKDRNQKELNIYSFKQVTRMNSDTKKDELLENPIYRLKVPVCKKDGRLGIWSNYSNEFKSNVFDARKMTKKTNYQPVPAKVKINGKLVDLNVTNAMMFISYKSLIGGHITFECIVSSKFGLSLNNAFYDLYVYRHKSKNNENSMLIEEIINMRGGDATESDDDDDDNVEPSKKSESKNGNDDDDDEEEEEEEEEDEDEDDDEEKDNKKSKDNIDKIHDSDDEEVEEVKPKQPEPIKPEVVEQVKPEQVKSSKVVKPRKSRAKA